MTDRREYHRAYYQKNRREYRRAYYQKNRIREKANAAMRYVPVERKTESPLPPDLVAWVDGIIMRELAKCRNASA